jgi:hypothetical protein
MQAKAEVAIKLTCGHCGHEWYYDEPKMKELYRTVFLKGGICPECRTLITVVYPEELI